MRGGPGLFWFSLWATIVSQGWVLLVATNFHPASAQEPASKPQSMSAPIVIAHRGASGYLPEHTEGAKVLAFAQGADYLEQDVVLSRDGVFVVSHDITMDETTNVAERFPARKRLDGRFYFADFDWHELSQLAVNERTTASTGSQVFKNRFLGSAGQRVLRLEDEIRLIQGLNRTLNRNVGLYIELKSPGWHAEHFGDHMGARLLPLLESFGYRTAQDRCFIQCFEPAELQYLANELQCQLPLIQLIGGRPLGLLSGQVAKQESRESAIAILKTELKEVAKFAQGIGPAIDLLVAPDASGNGQSTGVCEAAHALGMQVHPYTVRIDALPSWAAGVDQLHDMLLGQLKVDGFFTDFPDLGRRAVDAR